MTRGQDLYRHARTRIPGGTQLLSKRPEMFLPDGWPAYYERAKGAEVWDLDGRKYVDMSISGVGATVLGFADPDVDAAVRAVIDAGSMATLNSPEEVELADLFCEIHPWAQRVRFARGGGEAMAIAVRIARAFTGRDVIAFCGYHGWHDWYLAANLADDSVLDGHLLPGLAPAGVPRGLRGTARPFAFDDLTSLEQVVAEVGDDLAAVVMEPVRSREPSPGFLAGCRSIAESAGAVLVFDEVTSAMRLNPGGVHLTYGVDPHVAVFAKAIGNGYPIAAVIGVDDVMDAAQRSFISSTNWTERIGPTAALATIRKHAAHGVAGHLVDVGSRVQAGWREAASASTLDIAVSGIPPLAHFDFEHEDAVAMRTLFTRLMLERGFLAGASFYASYTHEDDHVDGYGTAVGEVFGEIAASLEDGSLADRAGNVAHSGFRRLT